MLIETEYNRQLAVRYALNWAFARNPIFYDFENIGGDCTNFVSQCLYAGGGTMNFSAENGWYYIDLDDRAPAWTGTVFLNRFLLTNEGAGVYGRRVPLDRVVPGDIIQLKDEDGRLYHSMIVTFVLYPVTEQNVFVSAHSYDARNRRLSTYSYADTEPIQILGSRMELLV